jgi:hypothetical protein
LSKGVRIAIVTIIVAAAIALGIGATTTDVQQQEVQESGDITQGKQLTLDLNENLSLKENP